MFIKYLSDPANRKVALGYSLAFLVPLIGFVLGVYFLVKDAFRPDVGSVPERPPEHVGIYSWLEYSQLLKAVLIAEDIRTNREWVLKTGDAHYRFRYGAGGVSGVDSNRMVYFERLGAAARIALASTKRVDFTNFLNIKNQPMKPRS